MWTRLGTCAESTNLRTYISPSIITATLCKCLKRNFKVKQWYLTKSTNLSKQKQAVFTAKLFNQNTNLFPSTEVKNIQ